MPQSTQINKRFQYLTPPKRERERDREKINPGKVAAAAAVHFIIRFVPAQTIVLID